MRACVMGRVQPTAGVSYTRTMFQRELRREPSKWPHRFRVTRGAISCPDPQNFTKMRVVYCDLHTSDGDFTAVIHFP